MATYRYTSNDISYNQVSQESHSANKGLAAGDAGVDQNLASGSHQLTLPELNANIVGLTFRCRNIGTAGTDALTVKPHANNYILGGFTLASSVVSSAGTIAKYVRNTGATSKKGDWVDGTAVSSTEWYICGSQGIWAFES